MVGITKLQALHMSIFNVAMMSNRKLSNSCYYSTWHNDSHSWLSKVIGDVEVNPSCGVLGKIVVVKLENLLISVLLACGARSCTVVLVVTQWWG